MIPRPSAARALTLDEAETVERAVLGILDQPAEETFRRIGDLTSDGFRAVAWDALSFAIFESFHALGAPGRGRARLGHVANRAAAALGERSGLLVDAAGVEAILSAVVGASDGCDLALHGEAVAMSVLVEAGLLLLANPRTPAREWRQIAAVLEVTAGLAA